MNTRATSIGCIALMLMSIGCTSQSNTPLASSPIAKPMPTVKAKLRDPYGVTSESDIRAFEKSIGYELPEDYRSFLLMTNGGEFHDYVCTPDGCGVSFLAGLNTGLDYSDLRQIRTITDDFVPADWLVIASDAGGDFVCLKLAEPNEGAVYSVSHEEAFAPDKITHSFREYIDSLILDPATLIEEEAHLHPAFRLIDLDDMAELMRQLDSGLSVEYANDEGKTLLMHAAWKCRLEIVQMFLDRKANVQARDHRGSTPIHYAVATHSPSCIRLLVAHGGNINDKDTAGESLLIYAVGNASIRSTQTLLELGVDVNYRGSDGKTARGHCWDEDILPLLLKAGAKE